MRFNFPPNIHNPHTFGFPLFIFVSLIKNDGTCDFSICISEYVILRRLRAGNEQCLFECSFRHKQHTVSMSYTYRFSEDKLMLADLMG